MRYVIMLMGVAALGGGALLCPQTVRAQVARTVIPDAALAVEIEAAIDELIEQLDRYSPEFTPEGRA